MVDRHQTTTRGVARRGSSVLLVSVGLVWAVAVVAGLLWMADFDLTPGPGMQPPARWPDGARLARGPYTLVMAAHPKCPCTRASLDELAVIMAASEERLTAHVLFFVPPGTDAEWWRTDLWAKAAAIPGVTPHVDRGGAIERQFGAITSGSVIVYDHDERLRFYGGVTAARGHAGENAGRVSLITLMDTGQGTRADTPVFGCPLTGPVATPTADEGR